MRYAKIMAVAITVVLVAGCGGGGEQPASPKPGQVRITVVWPALGEVEFQLIPARSKSIKVEVFVDDKSVAEGVIVKPSNRTTLENVLPSDDALLTVSAYPSENATGVVQATADMRIVIPALGIAYPKGGVPGDPIILTLESTIRKVQIAPDPASVDICYTVQLTATAKDDSDRTVLVRPLAWTVESGEAHATVDADGLVTGVSLGEAVVKATEPESGIFDTATVTVIGYEFLTKWGSEGLSGEDGYFYYPRGVAVDRFGFVYVADTGNHCIQMFTSTGTYHTTCGSGGSGDANLWSPQGVAVDTAVNMYVADTKNHRIQKFGFPFFVHGWLGARRWYDYEGEHEETGWHEPESPGWPIAGDGDGYFYQPRAVAVDTVGNIYVADHSDPDINHHIQKFSSSGTFLAQWGSHGHDHGQFNDPEGLAVDADGNVYVADTENHRIQKFSGSGTFIARWGSQGSGDGRFHCPRGVAVDADGNVYVADTGHHRIQKFSGSGTFITRWGSSGSGDGQFFYPNDVAVDADGNVYVADTSNHRIQKFRPAAP